MCFLPLRCAAWSLSAGRIFDDVKKHPAGNCSAAPFPKATPRFSQGRQRPENAQLLLRFFDDFNKVLPGIQVNFFGVFAAISAARRGTSQKIIRRWRSSVNFSRLRTSILEICPVATGSAQHAQQNTKRAQHWRSSENISAQKASVLFRANLTNRMKKARITPQSLRTVLTIGQPLQMHCKWTVNQR